MRNIESFLNDLSPNLPFQFHRVLIYNVETWHVIAQVDKVIGRVIDHYFLVIAFHVIGLMFFQFVIFNRESIELFGLHDEYPSLIFIALNRMCLMGV